MNGLVPVVPCPSRPRGRSARSAAAFSYSGGGMRGRELVLALALLALVPACQPQVSANQFVVDVSNQQSCVAVTSDIDGSLVCDSQGETAVITLALNPGNVYRFTESVLLPEGEGSNGTCQSTGSSGDLSGANECYEGTQAQYDVEVTQINMRRGLYGRDLELPYAYAAFHSKAYRKTFTMDQNNLNGFAQTFTPGADDDAVFYPTVRIDNIVTTSAIYNAGELLSFPGAPGYLETLLDLIDGVLSDLSLLNSNYVIWGEIDFEATTDDDQNALLVLVTDRATACQNILYTDMLTSVVSVSSARTFFDAPWVTSASREACDGGTCPGSYNCNLDFCCGSMPGQQSLSFDELNKCNDPSYCKERATWCDMSQIYYSAYKYPEWMNMPGQYNENNYDDDSDDDSCGSDNDNESSSGGICDFAECGSDITDKQAYYIAQEWCDCPNVVLTGDSPPAGTLDFSDCEALCATDGLGGGEDGEAATSMDINLSSKQGGSCGRFGPEDKRDDDDDDEQNVLNSTFLGGVGDGSKTCAGCDREVRSYCPSTCRDKSMQDLMGNVAGKTSPACRKLRGQAPRVDYVYVGVDDFDNIARNGMTSAGCVEQCLDQPGCNPSLECVDTSRPPLHDDDYENKLVFGPYRTNWVHDVIPGLNSELLTMHPNAGGTWYNDQDNIRAVPANDDTFGSVDDEFFCSSYGMNDQGTGTQTYVAECPPAFCIPDLDHQPDGKFFRCIDDEGDMNPDFICPDGYFPAGATAADVRRQCNRPFPRYADDYDPDPLLSDGSNPDGLHPSDPYDYDPRPATVCPLTVWDRVPLLAADQRRYVDTSATYRVAAFSTAEAFALYGPFCHAYYMDAYGTPQFDVRVTRRDLAPDNPRATQVVTVSVYSEEAAGGGFSTYYGISDDGTMLVRLRGVSSTSSGSALGTELNDMLVICNGTFNGLAGAPQPPYRMAGPSNDPRVAARSPWATIRDGVSYFFEGFLQTIYGHGVAVLNAEFVALFPIPQVLWSVPGSYDTRDYADLSALDAAADDVSIKRGSGWYTVTQRQQATYGEGENQIGMKADYFKNDDNAALACSKPRYSAVPGVITGFDWTVQQHNMDFDVNTNAAFNHRTQLTNMLSNNFGTYTRYLRDYVLDVSTPAIVFGRMMEFMSLPTCSDVIAALAEFGHQPNGYLRDAGSGPCDLPTMYPHGGSFYYKDPTVNNADTTVTVEISQVNAAFTGTVNVVQRGIFVDNPAPFCTVGENSSDGQITISAQNVGEFEADFLVVAQCDSDVEVTSSQSLSLSSEQIAAFTILLSHSNLGPAATNSSRLFSCDLFLTNPGAPDPTTEYFDTETLDNCAIVAEEGGAVTGTVPRTGSDTCLDYGTGCAAAPGAGGPRVDDAFGANWMLIAATTMLVLLLVSATCLCCSQRFATAQNKAHQTARIQKDSYKSRAKK